MEYQPKRSNRSKAHDNFYFPLQVNLPQDKKKVPRRVSPRVDEFQEMFTSLPAPQSNERLETYSSSFYNGAHANHQQPMSYSSVQRTLNPAMESGRLFQNYSNNQDPHLSSLLPDTVNPHFRYDLNKTVSSYDKMQPKAAKNNFDLAQSIEQVQRKQNNMDLRDVGQAYESLNVLKSQFMTAGVNQSNMSFKTQSLAPVDNPRNESRTALIHRAQVAQSSALNTTNRQNNTSLPPLKQLSNRRAGSISQTKAGSTKVPKLNLSTSPPRQNAEEPSSKMSSANTSLVNDLLTRVKNQNLANSGSRAKFGANIVKNPRPSLLDPLAKPASMNQGSANRFKNRTQSIPNVGPKQSHSTLPKSLKRSEAQLSSSKSIQERQSATYGVAIPEHLKDKFNIQPKAPDFVPVDPADRIISQVTMKNSPKQRDPAGGMNQTQFNLSAQRQSLQKLSPRARESKMSNNVSRLSTISLRKPPARSALKKKSPGTISQSQIKGQIASVNAIIKQMGQYSSQIQTIIQGDESEMNALSRQVYTPIAEDERMRLSDQSSIWHLESYRSLLMSQLSRDDVISTLKIVQLPEVFADPPVFGIQNYQRKDEDDGEKVQKILERYHGAVRPHRTKPLLDEYLRECEFDPEKVVCYTTNSNLVYNTVKLVEKYLSWHFTKSQNVNMFHLQFQQTEGQLVKSQNKIDYQMVMQNHFKASTNALRELYSEQIRAANWINPSKGTFESYLCTHDGKPIYLRQLLFIPSLFPAKVYGLQHRQFEVEGVQSLMSQSELQAIFPYKQFPVFDISSAVQLIVDTLQRKVKMSERNFQFVELRFLIHKTRMKPVLARMDSTLSLDVRLPDHSLIPLLFKIDHLVRKSFQLYPNTTIRHKAMFRAYWKKIIDQDENQTEKASIDAVSAFAAGQDNRIVIKPDSRQGQEDERSIVIRDSVYAESVSAESDLTVLPEEVAVVSVGSDESETAILRKQRAIKRKKDLAEQQKAYMAFMAQFYPRDAHIKTHKEFLEDQKRRMKAVYRVQRFVRHHTNMRLLQTHIARVIESKRVIRRRIAWINLRQNLEGRKKFKELAGRAAATWKVRRAVNHMIALRKRAKERILRFALAWKAKRDEALAKKNRKKKSKKKDKDDKKKKGKKDAKDGKKDKKDKDKKESSRKKEGKDEGKAGKKEKEKRGSALDEVMQSARSSKAHKKSDRSPSQSMATSRDRAMPSPLSMAEEPASSKREKKSKKESKTDRSSKRGPADTAAMDESLIIQEEDEGGKSGRKKEKKSRKEKVDESVVVEEEQKRGRAGSVSSSDIEESKEPPKKDKKKKKSDRRERSPTLGNDEEAGEAKPSKRDKKEKSSRRRDKSQEQSQMFERSPQGDKH